MRLTRVILNVFILMCLQTSAQFYTFQHFGHREGLNMATVNCISQSKDGYIWLGTDGAELIRFDGQEFEEIRVPEADNNYHFGNIFVNDKEVVYAAKYKGFYSYSRQKKNYTQLKKIDKGSGDAVAAFVKDSVYYLISDNAVFTRKKDKIEQLFSVDAGKDKLKLIHYVETKNAILVFTNHGQYFLREGKMISLSEWINKPIKSIKEYEFGYLHNEILTLFNRQSTKWIDIVLNERGGVFSIHEFKTQSKLREGEYCISTSFSEKNRKAAVLTNLSGIYEINSNKLIRIIHNYPEPLSEPNQIIVDLNGDYWLSSSFKGLYKISREPFTRLRLHQIYESPNISKPYITEEGEVIVGLMNGMTYITESFKSTNFRQYNFRLNGVTRINNRYYLATDRGVKIYHSTEYKDFPTLYYEGEKITFVRADDKYLWVGIGGKGLRRIDTESGEQMSFDPKPLEIPDYFYTGQVSSDNAYVYFGTNFGLYRYSKKDKTLIKINLDKADLGSYSGISTRDRYGTAWFAMEKGIVGITSTNEVKVLAGDKIFRTYLFYTINSDRYGNLIIGTNKGITYIKVNNRAEVLDVLYYDDKTGFNGYETHMRSQFQDGDIILLGTVEGLFLIDTDLLEKVPRPIPPVIKNISEMDTTSNSILNNFHFKFQVNNPKLRTVTYAYRLVEVSDDWIITRNNDVHFFGVESGDYTLEVRASYDGVHFGNISTYDLQVKTPIWRSSWFMIILLAIIVVINITLLNKYKKMENKNFLDTKDTDVHLRMTPTLLLFGTLAVTGSHIVAPILNEQLELHLGLSLSVGFVLFSLYLLALTARKNRNEHLYKHYLIIGFVMIMIHFFWEIYISSIHPFHIVGLVLTSLIGPYILGNIKSTIIFSLILLIFTSFCVIFVEDPVYPKIYFFISIMVMVSLLILSSYLRFDSLEKLIFISGIINKGNVPAVAFNNKGIVTYASENISNFIPLSHHEIVGKNISILNQFVPFEGEFKEVDVTREFKDGEKYLVPMTDAKDVVHWIEWSYKDFSSYIKVILGQDVSEKMELEHTYELLVQNAEDFIYRCDVNGNFVFLNDIAYKKLGFSKEELIGTHSISLVPKEYFEDVAQFYRNHFLEHKGSSYKEFPIRKKNNEVIWIAQYVTTLYAPGSSSRITGFIALARDITEIRGQQELIREQRDSITSSINYARRIQYNLLPDDRYFSSAFKEHFVIYKPQAIVSGDFYWMNKIGEHTVLVLADCTGHGVPGAFMTLLGINLLNAIVLEGRVIDPSIILNDLDKKLLEILPKGDGVNELNDAMEMTICVFDDKSDEMAFACAGSRFLIYENKSFTMLKGDNKHVGDASSDGFEGYSTHVKEFATEDILYLFTDGFHDQFGGPKDKKFSFRRMLELFESNINLTLGDQRGMIVEEFDDWVGDTEQTDDVTVVAIKKSTL